MNGFWLGCMEDWEQKSLFWGPGLMTSMGSPACLCLVNLEVLEHSHGERISLICNLFSYSLRIGQIISSIKFKDSGSIFFSATIMEYQVSSAWPIPAVSLLVCSDLKVEVAGVRSPWGS